MWYFIIGIIVAAIVIAVSFIKLQRTDERIWYVILSAGNVVLLFCLAVILWSVFPSLLR